MSRIIFAILLSALAQRVVSVWWTARGEEKIGEACDMLYPWEEIQRRKAARTRRMGIMYLIMCCSVAGATCAFAWALGYK